MNSEQARRYRESRTLAFLADALAGCTKQEDATRDARAYMRWARSEAHRMAEVAARLAARSDGPVEAALLATARKAVQSIERSIEIADAAVDQIEERRVPMTSTAGDMLIKIDNRRDAVTAIRQAAKAMATLADLTGEMGG